MNTEPKPERTFDDWWQTFSALFNNPDVLDKEGWRQWYETHQGIATFDSSVMSIEIKPKLTIDYTALHLRPTPFVWK